MTDTPYMSLTREQADVLRGELDTLRARVAELEADNQGSLKAAAYWKENWQRSEAHAAKLREALQDAHSRLASPRARMFPNAYLLDHEAGENVGACGICTALATTPAASLAAHDAEVLERAAGVCDVWAGKCADIQRDAEERWDDVREAEANAMGATAEELAAAIRALAAQEVKP